jgi:O-acetylhomoserine/O-acetylserine sulfhydrylase-like pyridoxal-dependent enzyme
MNAIALILVTCLPHSGDCKSIVQHPAPVSHEECNRRAVQLQQVICLYGDAASDNSDE